MEWQGLFIKSWFPCEFKILRKFCKRKKLLINCISVRQLKHFSAISYLLSQKVTKSHWNHCSTNVRKRASSSTLFGKPLTKLGFELTRFMDLRLVINLPYYDFCFVMFGMAYKRGKHRLMMQLEGISERSWVNWSFNDTWEMFKYGFLLINGDCRRADRDVVHLLLTKAQVVIPRNPYSEFLWF